MAKIHSGDRVMVMAGKDRGETGRVLRVDPKKDRVLVEGLNLVKRHEKIRMTQRGGQTGGITSREAWLHISNVQVLSPEDGKPTRVAYEIVDGKKQRVCARTRTPL
jgi:large subunit ribosomal protein L24